ncbi:hypothetical protein EVAR_97040_1 [Eumeta japonica]|uniref:Uncharacterized protein n=1 Tax=Eumeta variegata TaxID=151549 RepID=A0A4C1WL75_EUMVA|nr:hypothetical protein EVAR_97040_1 [Eumeta japonica]
MFIKRFLLADDRVKFALLACELQEKVPNEMNDSVRKRCMKINASKTRVLIFERSESTSECEMYKQKVRVSNKWKSWHTGMVFLKIMANMIGILKGE